MNFRRVAAAFALAGTTLALTAGAQQAPAGPAYIQIDCTEYANFAQRVAVHRMVESKLELVILLIRGNAGAPYGAAAQAYVREARLVYAEGLEPSEARFQAWKRCQAVLGRFGVDS